MDDFEKTMELAAAAAIPINTTLGQDAIIKLTSGLLKWNSPIQFSFFLLTTAHDYKTRAFKTNVMRSLGRFLHTPSQQNFARWLEMERSGDAYDSIVVNVAGLYKRYLDTLLASLSFIETNAAFTNDQQTLVLASSLHSRSITAFLMPFLCYSTEGETGLGSIGTVGTRTRSFGSYLPAKTFVPQEEFFPPPYANVDIHVAITFLEQLGKLNGLNSKLTQSVMVGIANCIVESLHRFYKGWPETPMEGTDWTAWKARQTREDQENLLRLFAWVRHCESLTGKPFRVGISNIPDRVTQFNPVSDKSLPQQTVSSTLIFKKDGTVNFAMMRHTTTLSYEREPNLFNFVDEPIKSDNTTNNAPTTYYGAFGRGG